MSKGITEPNKMLERTEAVLVVDLLDHALRINSDLYLQALVDPPAGIYLRRTFKPILVPDRVYYPKSRYMQPGGPIARIEDILSMDEDILDTHGTTIISQQDLRYRRQYMSIVPDIPIVAIEMGLSLVTDYLSKVAPYARCMRAQRQESLVRPEYWHLIESDVYETCFEDLLDTVFDFVGRDTWHIYFTRLKGTALIIEKVIDYRIYRYHELEYQEHIARTEEGF